MWRYCSACIQKKLCSVRDESDFRGAETRKQLISIRESSTEEQSDLTIHTITSLEPLVTNLAKNIWMSLFVCSGDLVQFLFYAVFSFLFYFMSLYGVILACRVRCILMFAFTLFIFLYVYL